VREPAGFDSRSDNDGGRIVGVLLAAGAGRRAHGPKALRVAADGTAWLPRSIAVLRDGGCAAVIVVLGCAADRARVLIAESAFHADPTVTVVEAPEWQHGMSNSLRSGLLAAQHLSWEAVLIHLVDLPDVSVEVVRRLLSQSPSEVSVLARAVYRGRPGHPVLLGRDHLPAILVGLSGDRGARDYLAQHGASGVECGDLATGQDRDT
jgi:CTP:molybdopterin cytidylyltransferase MocA